MEEIKKIGVLSTGKIGLLFGIFIGLIMALLLFVISNINIPQASQLGFIPFTFSAIVLMPAYYAVIYFIVGVLFAFLYNIFVRWVGGIKIEIGKAKKK